MRACVCVCLCVRVKRDISSVNSSVHIPCILHLYHTKLVAWGHFTTDRPFNEWVLRGPNFFSILSFQSAFNVF